MIDKKELFFHWDQIAKLADRCSKNELLALLAVPPQMPSYIEDDETFHRLEAMMLSGAKPLANVQEKELYQVRRTGLLLATLPKDVRETIRAAIESDKNELTLIGIRFDTKMVKAIAEILAVTEIQHLSLVHVDLNDDAIIAVAKLALKSLNLSSNKSAAPWFERTKLAGFDAIVSNTSITSLTLVDNALIILDDTLLDLKKKTGLQHLNIASNRIPFHGICRILKNLADSTTLQSLNLSDNKSEHYFDFELEDSFAYFAEHTHLSALYLTGTAFDNRCAEFIASNTTIITLDVSQTRLEDEGLKALLQMKQLKYLNISGCEISKAMKAALAERKDLFVLNDAYPYSGYESFKDEIAKLQTPQAEALKSLGTFAVAKTSSSSDVAANHLGRP